MKRLFGYDTSKKPPNYGEPLYPGSICPDDPGIYETAVQDRQWECLYCLAKNKIMGDIEPDGLEVCWYCFEVSFMAHGIYGELI